MKGLAFITIAIISVICSLHQTCQGIKPINWYTSTRSLRKIIWDFKAMFFGRNVNDSNLKYSLDSLNSYLQTENVRMLDKAIAVPYDWSLHHNQQVIMDAFKFITMEVAFKQTYKANIKDYKASIADKIQKTVEAFDNITYCLKVHAIEELRNSYGPKRTIDFCKTGMSHLQYLDFILNYVKIVHAQRFHIQNVTSVPWKVSGGSEIWGLVNAYQRFMKFFKEEAMSHASLELWNCGSGEYSEALSNIDRYYISTQAVQANFAYNRVITGAKFEVRDNTIYIRIQQGKLLSNGIVDRNSLEWLEIDDRAGMIYYAEKGLIVSRRNREEMTFEKDGMDEFDLTEVRVPEGRVLVGIGFEKLSEKRVGLKLTSVKYDYNRGRLELGRQFHNIDKTATYRYIQNTKIDGDRNSPLIDTRSLKTTPPVPLSGASLHVIQRDNDNGVLLGLKFATYDIRPHIPIEIEE